MVIIDQLRIAEGGKKMYIDIHVNEADVYADVYLKDLTIMTADKVSETAPGTPTDNYIYNIEFESNLKEAHLVLDKGDIDAAFLNNDGTGERIHSDEPLGKIPFESRNFSQDLFFVYIGTDGAADPCVPCPLCQPVTVGITFDETMLYNAVMGFTKELAQTCTVHQGFVDYILLWNAFKASVETGHYIQARKFWGWLKGNFRNSSFSVKPGGCNCHG